MKQLIIIILYAVICSVAASAQVAGLENDPRYKALIARDQALRAKEDSLSRRLADVRAALRTSSDQRAQLGAQILKLESEMFEVRNQTGIVAGQINAIEQEFVIRNLESVHLDSLPRQDAGVTAVKTMPQSDMRSYLRKMLSVNESTMWAKAGRDEAAVDELVNEYISNYQIIKFFAQSYAVESSAVRADSILRGYKMLERTNVLIADSVAVLWNEIFDNKTYICNLLMDKADNRGYLSENQSRTAQLRDKEAQLRGSYESDVVGLYPLEKQFVLECEEAVAKYIGDRKYADSLRGVMRGTVLAAEPLKINMEERTFIDYEAIKVGGGPQYNASRPIPQVAVYPRGTVYRILLGSYQVAQSPSIFRNVSPLAVLRGEDGRYRYFAGGFENLAQADEALATLRKTGFRSPEIVAWIDGKYRDSVEETRPEEGAGQLFRVQVMGTEKTLPDDLRTLIAASGGAHDISRIVLPPDKEGVTHYLFIAGTFEDESSAKALAQVIRGKQYIGLDVQVVQLAAGGGN